jgi:uridine kinase
VHLPVVALAAVVRTVEQLPGVADRPVVVAVDGYSGAGKSTIAGRLADALHATVVHIDDFYADLPDPVRWRLTPGHGVDRYFDWTRLRDQALLPLHRGHTARFRCCDWATGASLTATIREVPARPMIILEGVYAARPQLADHVDLTVLVKTPADVRADRIRRRDHPPHHQQWHSRWHAAEALYFHTIRPPHSFHLITPGHH